MARTNDDGITLIELSVTMALFGVLATIGVYSFRNFQHSLEEQGAQREVVSELRDAQTRAVAENTTYCVDFGATPSTTYRMYRVPGADQGPLAAGFTCTTGTLLSLYRNQTGTSISSADFEQRNGVHTAFVLFTARGSASAGSVNLSRGDSSKTYAVSVDGLTGRVSSNGI